ncbi:hypothetical protein C8Q74DRAFT_1371770 [Fomes fomentarius]|nr:hypothetical protein C8Q74DRAFT_1371770 [Fomes fomentarius]
MSADTIARWNAIPLNRPEPDQPSDLPSLKRTRNDGDGDDDGSEDNVSLVSRTPSPPPPDAMEIDKYDEYYTRRPQREVITVETKIKSTNIGFSMLAKMGWVEGTPLGLSGEGRVEPIPFNVKNDLTGLGKATQDVRMIETTVAQRRELDSERQTKETEEQRKHREDAVARREAVKSEISSVLKAFYCEVCEKQFQNVAQYDEHTNSYAHHHKVRFRDMQAAQRASRNTEEEVNKRKEKERKREEKELRKIAKAAGVKMTKPPVALASVAGTESTNGGGGFKKGGWATATASASSSVAPAELPTRSGWATVGASQPSSSSPIPSKGGWAPVSASTPHPIAASPSPSEHASSTTRGTYSSPPSFRTGGWTSLETSNAPQLPVPSQSYPPPPPSSVAPAPPPPRQDWTGVSRQSDAGERYATPVTTGPLRPLPTTVQTEVPTKPAQEVNRSGWQKFRAGAPGRRR